MEPPCRVVVTGMGIVAPNGIGLDAFWDSLIHCKSGIGPITRFDTEKSPVKVAGEVRNFDMRDTFGPRCHPYRYSLQTQMGLVACHQAFEQAGLTPEQLKKSEVIPVVMGVASGATHLVEYGVEKLKERGNLNIRESVRAIPPAATAGAIAQVFGFQVSATTISSCCPSGLDAVIEAAKLIRTGQSDLVLTGAVDSYVTPTTVAGFAAIRINSASTEFPPDQLSRPFDAKRSGAVFSEGAGFLVLERLDAALARGAVPLMEIVSGARFTDSVGGDELGGMGKSMELALRNAGIYPGQVDYICADAASQPTMDPAEVKMIKRVFGAYAYQVPVSSIRGVMGHALAAAALMQMVTLAKVLEHQLIPPTANLTCPDPDCDLDHVPLTARDGKVQWAIANSRGMARENSTLVVRKVS